MGSWKRREATWLLHSMAAGEIFLVCLTADPSPTATPRELPANRSMNRKHHRKEEEIQAVSANLAYAMQMPEDTTALPPN